MQIRRFYTPELLPQDDAILLPPAEANHALRVLRMQVGDPCELFADGRRYAARVDAIDGEEVRLAVTGPLPTT